MFPHPTSQLSGMRGMSDSDPSVFGLARETLPHLPFRPGGHSLASRPAKNEHYSQADLRPRADIRSILASDPVPRHTPSDHSNNRHSSTQDIQGVSRSYAPFADHSPEPQTPVLYGSPVGNHKEPSYSQYENVSRGHFAPYTWNSQQMEPRQPALHFQEPVHFQEVDMGECNAVTKTKRRGNLPKKAVEILKYWFISHQAHPYPTEEEKQAFVKTTGLSMSQVRVPISFLEPYPIYSSLISLNSIRRLIIGLLMLVVVMGRNWPIKRLLMGC